MRFIYIKATKFLYWYSKLTGTKGDAKMAAFYPFIFVSNQVHPKMRPYFINHELIHFAQQKELLLIGNYLLHFFEWLYVILVKGKKKGMEAYLYRSTEQEAYDNMFNLDYLKTRPHFNHLKKYWHYKPVIWEEYMKNKENIESSI